MSVFKYVFESWMEIVLTFRLGRKGGGLFFFSNKKNGFIKERERKRKRKQREPLF
jgi:hypothetical protein